MKTSFVEIGGDTIVSYFDVNHAVDNPADFKPPRYLKVHEPLRNCAVIYDPETKMLVEDATNSQSVKASDFKTLRMKRDRLLAETDWTQGSDNSLTREERIKYKVYRQKLRDITKTDSPYYVKWPKIDEPILTSSIDKAFTGQQTCVITNDNAEEGMIVCANQNKYGVEGTTSSNAITINESAPNVSLCSCVMDKSCFGVISQSFVHNRAYINSVGEGAMWVTNINGPLESGDYITTSNVAGYGMKQDDDILHNYTVAKITMDCDFEPLDIPVQRILREKANVTYWYQLEVVDLATWSNLATEQRSSEEETYYTIDEHVQVYGYVDEQSNVFIPPAHDIELYNKIQEHVVSDEVYGALPDEEKGNYSNTASNTYTYTQVISMTPEVWSTLEEGEQNTYVHGYYTIVTREVDDPTATEHTRTIYQKVVNETKTEAEGYLSEVREEWVNVLDEHGQLQWEDVPTGETEPAYRIRYLDADGNITTRHNEVYRAAFVGCTYHCG